MHVQTARLPAQATDGSPHPAARPRPPPQRRGIRLAIDERGMLWINTWHFCEEDGIWQCDHWDSDYDTDSEEGSSSEDD